MRKSSILFLSVFSILVLASCGTAKAPENNDEGTSNDTSKSEATESADSVGRVMDTATNFATCMDSCNIIEADTGLISKDTCRVGCIMAEAQETRDPQLCIDNVTDALMLPACLTGVAEAIGDITICDKIGPDKNDLMRGACYTSVVEKTKDVSACEAIKGSMMYSGCVGSVSQN